MRANALITKLQIIKSLIRSIIIIAGAILFIGYFGVTAQAASRYPAGIEGVEAASVPPPGFHYRFYYVNAKFDELKDDKGNKVPIGFDLNVAGYIQRFIYITDKKLLGADYGMNFILPYTNIDLKTDFGFEDSSGFGDIVIEPFLLAWHKPRYDIALGIAAIPPTGKYDNDRAVNNGEGFWSTMLSLGGTWFFDDHKSLSASMLTRTVYNFENNDTDEQKGMEFCAEWGIGKTIQTGNLLIRPGITGYAHWDISDHDGTDHDNDRYRKYAIGAEINLFWLPYLLQGNLRALYEFETENGPEGSQIIFTLTKSF